ncbi:MAG: hypothetical protein JEZ14_14900 [Marinilabiliaceae bacterium]|nr:hypothetical protein [Marinilabiliaceae bacterium]
MDQIYQKIIETFNANSQVFVERNLPPVRQVDIYMGQPDAPEIFELFLPGVFVEWGITPGTNGEPDQLQLDFHILQEPGTHTEHFSARLTEGLEYILMVKTVKYLVNRLRAENSTPLTYAGERPRVTPFFKYHIVSYTCSIDSDTGSLTAGENKDVQLTGYELTSGKLQKNEAEPPAPVIEIY